jgi:exopolysaccharide biosynthesis glucuronosyltransferase PssE
MIFVTVGYSQFSFDRMISSVDNIFLGLGIERGEVFFQVGTSKYLPRSGNCCTYTDFEDMSQYVRAADLVISHAGVGSILLCLINNKKPIIFPRLKQYGEHVDDHQLQLANRLKSSGLVFCPSGTRELRDAIRQYYFGGGDQSLSLPQLTEERSSLIKTVTRLLREE